ncbi:MAG: glutamyl-tRNA reductase [Desulfobacterales bacterium]|nr:MAG: glutamyl-tRNA reductase [Desulfobacterales bacterium]
MSDEQLLLFGVNHKTTPIEIREEIALSDGYDEPLTALKSIEGVKECCLLSTCNRVELFLVVRSGYDLRQEIVRFLFQGYSGYQEREQFLYVLSGREAVVHLFMVAASLDSMIVGEAQILGQLKTAYRHAVRLGCTGPLLNKLFHKSFSAAKRVRTETAIGSSAVSISFAAVQLAKKIFGSLNDKKVLLVGAGEMAELAAEHLVGQGIAEMVVANRTLARAVDLAKRFHGRAISMDELLVQLELVDIIISSTGAPGIILKKEDVKPVMRLRKNRPLFFIDIAVPRDLDPGLGAMQNIYLYDIDDLSNVVEINRFEREREAVKARRIIDEEAIKFQDYYASLTLRPTILDLKTHIEGIGNSELERTLRKMSSLSEEDRRSLEKMVSAINSRLLHNPLLYLKADSCKRETRDTKIATLREVFRLGK